LHHLVKKVDQLKHLIRCSGHWWERWKWWKRW